MFLFGVDRVSFQQVEDLWTYTLHVFWAFEFVMETFLNEWDIYHYFLLRDYLKRSLFLSYWVVSTKRTKNGKYKSMNFSYSRKVKIDERSWSNEWTFNSWEKEKWRWKKFRKMIIHPFNVKDNKLSADSFYLLFIGFELVMFYIIDPESYHCIF